MDFDKLGDDLGDLFEAALSGLKKRLAGPRLKCKPDANGEIECSSRRDAHYHSAPVVESAGRAVHCMTLAPEVRAKVIAAFNRTNAAQLGKPERVGPAGPMRVNPGIYNATGRFTWLGEHIGDLTERMTQGIESIVGRYAAEYDFRYGPMREKVDRALGGMDIDHLGRTFVQQVSDNLRGNYRVMTEEGQTSRTFEEFTAEFIEAAEIYAAAHAAIPVYNEAQWHARQAAVEFGHRRYTKCRSHLEALRRHLGSKADWAAYAGLVSIDPDGEVVPYGAASLTEGLDDGGWKPMSMDKPTVLYRAMSIPELTQLWIASAVHGGGNSFFTIGDSRQGKVFFGDKLSSNLIWQGHEIERQASARLSKHPIHATFRHLQQEIKDQVNLLVSRTQVDLRALNQRRVERGHPPIKLDDDFYDKLSWGNDDAVWRACQYCPNNRSIATELRRLKDQEYDLQNKYRELHKAMYQKIKAERAEMPFDSAVIRTKPVTGGDRYTKENGGSSGMGDEDEYTFYPGEIEYRDIDAIMIYKDRQLVDTIEAADLGAYLERHGIFEMMRRFDAIV